MLMCDVSDAGDLSAGRGFLLQHFIKSKFAARSVGRVEGVGTDCMLNIQQTLRGEKKGVGLGLF